MVSLSGTGSRPASPGAVRMLSHAAASPSATFSVWSAFRGIWIRLGTSLSFPEHVLRPGTYIWVACICSGTVCMLLSGGSHSLPWVLGTWRIAFVHSLASCRQSWTCKDIALVLHGRAGLLWGTHVCCWGLCLVHLGSLSRGRRCWPTLLHVIGWVSMNAPGCAGQLLWAYRALRLVPHSSSYILVASFEFVVFEQTDFSATT